MRWRNEPEAAPTKAASESDLCRDPGFRPAHARVMLGFLTGASEPADTSSIRGARALARQSLARPTAHRGGRFVRIFVNSGERWSTVGAAQQYANEDKLQELIKDIFLRFCRRTPTPLTWCIRASLPVRRRTRSTSFGVGSNGAVSIIECKLARNPESKRKVVRPDPRVRGRALGDALKDFERRFLEAESRYLGAPAQSPSIF